MEIPDVQVAPSATPVVDVPAPSPELNDDFSTFSSEEYHEYRKTGKLPEKAPKAAPAPAPKPESSAAPIEEETEGESAATPEVATTQEQKPKPRRSDANTRIQELLAENKRLKSEAEAGKRQPATPTPAASSPASAEEQYTRPEPKEDDTNQDGSVKYKSFNDYVKDLGRWSAEQTVAQAQREQLQAEQRRNMETKMNEARKRYQDFDKTSVPVLESIINDQAVHPAVKAVIGDSPVLADLLYVMGGDAEELAELVHLAKTNPIAAIRKVTRLESVIEDELSRQNVETISTQRNDKGQFTAPVKVSQAPPPPANVGGKTSPPADEVANAIEKDDFNSYASAANRRDLARGR